MTLADTLRFILNWDNDSKYYLTTNLAHALRALYFVLNTSFVIIKI